MTNTTANNPIAALDCGASVNAVLVEFPATLRVFNQFGVDTCCGSSLSVTQAARAAGVDAEALCAALHEALVV
jgi:regulator of cell morphogenesis and NO signaling